MVCPHISQVIDGSLDAFLYHSGVCRTCRETLKEMIGIEVQDPPVLEVGVGSVISEQMERLTLVSINYNASLFFMTLKENIAPR